ncbi:MAG: hypothetical protein AAGD96_09835 [Chloroflexota bacterium]
MRINVKAGCALSFVLALTIMTTVFVVSLGLTSAGIVALLSS